MTLILSDPARSRPAETALREQVVDLIATGAETGRRYSLETEAQDQSRADL